MVKVHQSSPNDYQPSMLEMVGCFEMGIYIQFHQPSQELSSPLKPDLILLIFTQTTFSENMESSTMHHLANQEESWVDEEYEAVFSDDVPLHLAEPKLRLVGKLFCDREINKKILAGMINGAWSHFCEPTIQDIPRARNIFIFIFNQKEEMEKAWEGRPWQISGSMLQLKQWDQATRPQNIDFNLAEFWVQVHGIPDHKRTVPNVEAAVAMFKKIHNIDMRGLNPDRYMEFIRVFIQIDLNRPLPPGSYCTTGGVREWLGFRYEKLYVLCYYCGRHGHSKAECPRKRADQEAGIAGPPEGRFTPWMKAGTKASRPPPPPRGRVVHHSPGDAGSSTGSPGFLQNQLWIPGRESPAAGSFNPGSPATPSAQGSEESWGHGNRGPPGFTPHPFPPFSSSPRSAMGPQQQRLHTPSPCQNPQMYGAIPFLPPQTNFQSGTSSAARNLNEEMEAAARWAYLFPQQMAYQHGDHLAQGWQAHDQSHYLSAHQKLLGSNNNMGLPTQQKVTQMVMELNSKMDLNKKPAEIESLLPTHRNEEGQAEHKKRKHGQPLDFERPYFSTGEGASKPRNAIMKIKGKKHQSNLRREEAEGGPEDYGKGDNQQHQAAPEAPVAGYKPPGGE
ncbi:unnamed protein product [Linum trigynum]|uniref:CCHC-type domain-containing protein n=1 Tax=Linum trigynum TaxID=586398 RepID=A0AAV2DX93_9ROSI